MHMVRRNLRAGFVRGRLRDQAGGEMRRRISVFSLKKSPRALPKDYLLTKG
jgi:hypothetical protein